MKVLGLILMIHAMLGLCRIKLGSTGLDLLPRGRRVQRVMMGFCLCKSSRVTLAIAISQVISVLATRFGGSILFSLRVLISAFLDNDYLHVHALEKITLDPTSMSADPPQRSIL